MKILVVIPSLGGGGAERVVSLLTTEWAKRHQVLIALFDASRLDYPYGGRIVDLGLPASSGLARKSFNVLLRTKRLMDVLRRERPDRIFAFMESANFPSIAAAAFSNCLDRLWVSVRNNPAHMSLISRAVMPFLYRLPRRVIAISKGVKQELESMHIPAGRISTILNPVVVRDSPDRVQSSIASVPDQFILAAGRLVRQKGFDRLLTAFDRISHNELQLVILGEGLERANLARQACELGIGDRVHLPGRVSEIDCWYRNAECFVLSSRYEGLGNVLLEAMANGCPVVSFDCPYGPSELIEDGENGLLVLDGDVNALASAISRVRTDERLRLDLATKGLESVAKFSVAKTAARWLAQ